MIIDITAITIIDILLYSICNTKLTLVEINELIIGLMQNGIYVTLTNKFNIDALNNPFQNKFLEN